MDAVPLGCATRRFRPIVDDARQRGKSFHARRQGQVSDRHSRLLLTQNDSQTIGLAQHLAFQILVG